jgi:hypothetical protein
MSRTIVARRGAEITVRILFLKIGYFPPGISIGIVGVERKGQKGVTTKFSWDIGIAPTVPGIGPSWGVVWEKPEKPEKPKNPKKPEKCPEPEK